MYACGLRISEAATLQVTAIDGVNGLVRVVGKGNKERCVPLPQPVLDELRRLEDASQPALAVPQPEPQRTDRPRRAGAHVPGGSRRSRHRQTLHAAFAATWLCHAAPGERRR
jgi:integrase